MTATARVMILLVALAATAQAAELNGKFVRVSIPGREKILSLAEVNVISCGRNVALKMKATQSSTDCGGVAGRAVDGNTDGNYGRKSVTHTKDKGGSEGPWWMVELAGQTDIDEIVVYNRDGANERLLGAVIEVLDGDGKVVFKSAPLGQVAKSYTLEDGKVTARGASRPASAKKPSARGPSYGKPNQNYSEMIAEGVAAVYARKGGWRETVIAARDALWMSEGVESLKWLEDSGVSIEVLIAGPFKAEERDRLKFELEDGADDFKLNGQALTWRATRALKFNVVNDLAEIAGLVPGDCALVRMDFARPKDAKGRRPDVSVTYCGEYGCAQLPQHVGNLNVRKPRGSAPFLVPEGRAMGLSLEAGMTSRLYIAAKTDATGKCEVAIIPRYRHFDRDKSIDTQMAIAERAGADFPDAKSQVEMKLELADDIWHNPIGHRGKRSPRNWFAGRGEEYLAWRYREAVKRL
ncbi:MAG: galactose-binding domain-containing protein, partial [Planctomycetota bacterium]